MPYITPRGNPKCPIWVISESPLSTDTAKGYMFSGGMGHVFDKMLKDAGISDVYVTSRRPNTDEKHAFAILENELNNYKPPLVLCLDEAAQAFIPECKPFKGAKSYKTQLSKYVGSLLKAPSLNYPHYAIPLYGPGLACQNWTERNITTYFDMQKIRVELEFWRKNGSLQPLPYRDMKYHEMPLDELLSYLTRFESAKLLSNDIEICYLKKDSDFFPHPGYPLTLGLADSSTFGISFNLFRPSMAETKVLWRKLEPILYEIPQLGQNFFNFDAKFLSSLGFQIDLSKVKDTMLRHHVLWPELPHKLQFQTRQYTREIYYKDEGHNWNLKNMSKLRRYNCLDVCCTYEIYEQQEEEFKARPQLA